jgi:hypothetical protein
LFISAPSVLGWPQRASGFVVQPGNVLHLRRQDRLAAALSYLLVHHSTP